MSTTAKRMFYGAYRDARLINLEQTVLSADQEEEARQLYNRMVDAFAVDGLEVSHVARTLFNVTGGTGDYTIGPGATWDTVLPQRIERAGIILGDSEVPLYPMTLQDYQEWQMKGSVSSAFSYWYERSIPLGVVHLIEVPTDATQIALYLETLLSQIDAAADYSAVDLEFHYGYQEMLETNLAVRLADSNPRSNISPMVVRRAQSSLANLMGANHRPLSRTSDFQFGRGIRSNIYTGNRY